MSQPDTPSQGDAQKEPGTLTSPGTDHGSEEWFDAPETPSSKDSPVNPNIPNTESDPAPVNPESKSRPDSTSQEEIQNEPSTPTSPGTDSGNEEWLDAPEAQEPGPEAGRKEPESMEPSENPHQESPPTSPGPPADQDPPRSDQAIEQNILENVNGLHGDVGTTGPPVIKITGLKVENEVINFITQLLLTPMHQCLQR